jgi:hypothetical protein
MSDKKRNAFFTLFFVLVLKTSVLSLVHPPPTRTRDKTAVFSTWKKTRWKLFFLFFIERIVIISQLLKSKKNKQPVKKNYRFCLVLIARHSPDIKREHKLGQEANFFLVSQIRKYSPWLPTDLAGYSWSQPRKSAIFFLSFF